MVNRVVENKQHTICFHVDGVLSLHENPKVNDDFARWAQKTYGDIKPVDVHRGKVQDFLGMTLDFSKPGECHVRQEEYIQDIVNTWPEQVNKVALTPLSNNELLKQGHGKMLSQEKREIFTV